MKITTELPTEAGVFWYRPQDSGWWPVRLVESKRGLQVARFGVPGMTPLRYFVGEWVRMEEPGN